MGRLVLVLGGARSGKTRVAMRLAGGSKAAVVYVATAEAGDEEMEERIARHRADRPAGWRTLEAPLALDELLHQAVFPGETVLLDCLSVWLSNELLTLRDWPPDTSTVEREASRAAEEGLLAKVERLAHWAQDRPGDTLVVSNEVGSGVVPAFPLGRLYRDILGRANQAVAARAAPVLLVVAGIGTDLRQFEYKFADREHTAG